MVYKCNLFGKYVLTMALSFMTAVDFSVATEDPSSASTNLALERLAAHDSAAAVKMMEEVTAREPKNGRNWRVLGVAYQQTKQFDKAIDAYRKSIEVEPQFLPPIFNIGVLYALKGDSDQAFEWLLKAKSTRKVDMTGVAQNEDLASLRKDARYTSLLTKPEDFKNAFVEDVKIIHEWDGEAAHDQFGWIARNLGDVDNDGVPDFVTSAPTSSAGGDHAGRVYVYSTRSGKLLWKVDGKPKDELGTGVECAGDTNGDGIADVVASAPGGHSAYIYSGKDGHVLVTLKSQNKEEEFGRHVSGIGDVDHDGYADVTVGAPPPEDTPPGKGTGHAYIYSGKDGTNLLTLTGESEGDGFGSAVAGYADKNRMFLVVGAPHAGSQKKGRVFVYDRLSSTPKFIIEGDETAKELGAMFVSVVGDLNGDGIPDTYASDWSNEAKGHSTGRIYVYSGRDGSRLLTLTGETAGEGFGTCPAPAGDVDRDGHDDLIVGAWQYAGAAASAGRAYLYSGKNGKLIRTYTCRIPGDTFGFDAVGMGDVDKDGTTDFLITSGWSGVSGFHSGRVFLISSGIK